MSLPHSSAQDEQSGGKKCIISTSNFFSLLMVVNLSDLYGKSRLSGGWANHSQPVWAEHCYPHATRDRISQEYLFCLGPVQRVSCFRNKSIDQFHIITKLLE